MDAIQVKGLVKRYQGFTLDNVSFNVKEGSIVGFVGINGSGKTTTLKSILSLIHPDSGYIAVMGKDVQKQESELMIKENIGVVLDNDYFFQKLKIKEMTSIVRSAYKHWDDKDYYRYIKAYGLSEDKKIDSLSKGMKMKYALTLAFSHHAKILIMDEPTSGLDPFARDEFDTIVKQFVTKEPDNSVLFSSHITSDIEKTASEVVFIHKGKLIFQKKMSEINDSGKSLEEVMLGTIKEFGDEDIDD